MSSERSTSALNLKATSLAPVQYISHTHSSSIPNTLHRIPNSCICFIIYFILFFDYLCSDRMPISIPYTQLRLGNTANLRRIKTFNSSIEWRGVPDALPTVEEPLAVDGYKVKESHVYLGLRPLESCPCLREWPQTIAPCSYGHC